MAEHTGVFSRPMPARDLPATGRPFAVDAGADERAALAERFGILEIRRLHASGRVLSEAGGKRIRLDGRLEAEVVQTCVVTLEPVVTRIDAPLQRLYGSEVADAWEEGMGGEIFLDLSSDFPAEPLTGDTLDLGWAAAEQLALDLPPYPRAPGAEFGGFDETPQAAVGSGGLTNLATWRKGSQEAG